MEEVEDKDKVAAPPLTRRVSNSVLSPYHRAERACVGMYVPLYLYTYLHTLYISTIDRVKVVKLIPAPLGVDNIDTFSHTIVPDIYLYVCTFPR